MILSFKNQFRNLLIIPFLLIAIFVNAQGDFEVQAGESTSGCGPLSVQFEAIPDISKTVDMYVWDLGNGTNSVLEKPGTVYIIDGYYDVQLDIYYTDGTSETINKPDLIEVYAGPTVGFTASVTTGCAPLTVNFINTTIAGDGALDPSKTIWQFGEDGVAMGENPSFTFTKEGEYDVSLFVADENGCKGAIKQSGLIKISLEMEANFYPSKYTIEGDSAEAEFMLSLPDSSSASNLFLEWDFDNDGTFDTTGDSISYIFNKIGDSTFYDVRLRITDLDTGCSDDTLMVNAVKMYEPDYDNPFRFSTDFEGSPREYPCAPAVVFFTAQANPEKEVVNYFWEIGDSKSVSILESSSLVFAQPGKYDAKLTVYYGDTTIKTILKKDYIVVNGVEPAFTASTTSGYFPLTVTFFNNSISQGDFSPDTAATRWDMGNGDIITGHHDSLIYTYNQPGVYMPSLLIQDETGCSNSVNLIDSIEVKGFQPNFLVDINPICQNEIQLTFTDNTPPLDSSNFVQYGWDIYNDGTFDYILGNSPIVYVFPLQTDTAQFEVRMEITNDSGYSESVVKPIMLIRPQTDFHAEETFGVSPFTTTFSPDLDYPSDTKIMSWDFDGDGVVDTVAREPRKTFYNTTDDTLFYDVALYLQDTGQVSSCADTVFKTKHITILPKPKAVVSINQNKFCTENFTVDFNGANSLFAEIFRWDFDNDGTFDDFTENPSHFFTGYGEYEIHFQVENFQGDKADTIIQITSSPIIPDFSADVLKGCEGEFTTIFQNTTNSINSSVLPATEWLWEIRNLDSVLIQSSTEFEPTITLEGGIYSVSLTASNGSCSENFTKSNYLKVVSIPDLLDFSIKNAEITVGEILEIKNISLDDSVFSDSAYFHWDYTTDGIIDTVTKLNDDIKLNTNFLSPGEYTTSLWYKNQGCEMEPVSHSFEILAEVKDSIINIPVTGIKLNKEIQSIDSAANFQIPFTVLPENATNQSVIWSSENEGIAKIANGIVTGISAGETMILVESIDGEFKDTLKLKVTTPEIEVVGLQLNTDTVYILEGETKSVMATVHPENATHQEVIWESRDTVLATVNEGEITGVSYGETIITVSTEDGSFTDSLFVKVSRPIIEVIGLTIDTNFVSIEVGESFQITAGVTPNNATNQNISWTSENDTIAKVVDGLITGLKPGETTVTVITEDGNLEKEIRVVVFDPEVPITKITLDTSTLDLKVGETTQVAYEIQPQNATDQTVFWQSEDSTVATVSDGLVTGISPGEAKVILSSIDGQVKAEAIVNVSTLTGIDDDIENGIPFEVYPNPVKKQLTVKAPKNSFIEIFDVLGNKVFQQKMTADITTIYLQLKSGFYLVKIEGESFSQRLIVE